MFCISLNSATDLSLVKKLKDYSALIIDHFLTQQERMIPSSIKAGFSLFHALYSICYKEQFKCKKIIDLLESSGITKEHFSLCNWICFNAFTGLYHQDDDSSYSMICVPNLNYKQSPVYSEMRGSYKFSFKWNPNIGDDSSISFLLEPGISIYFLGTSCSHRQEVIKEGIFLNFSSYQNRRLFSNMLQSLKRCITSES